MPALEARQERVGERVGENNPRGTDPINQLGDIRDVKNPNRAKGDQQQKPLPKLQGATRAQLPSWHLESRRDHLRSHPGISFELSRIPKLTDFACENPS